ncbi:MAG: LEA type 2 family protein [Planctomycetota bacterium]
MFQRFAVVGILAVAMCSWFGCSAAPPILKNLNDPINGADFKGVDLAFDVEVENQLPFALKSTRGKYGIDIEDTPFLNWDDVPAMNLPASDVGMLTLPARVEYASLIEVFKSMATATEIPYRLHGALVFPVAGKDFDLPFAHEDTMPGPAEALKRGASRILDRQ